MREIAVLIVDDSATMRALIGGALTRHPGFTVAASVSSVSEARHVMQTVRHDVMTLDLVMPVTDGFAFLDELSGRGHMPIVVVSALVANKSDMAAQAVRKGARACFDKTKVLADHARFLRTISKAAGIPINFG